MFCGVENNNILNIWLIAMRSYPIDWTRWSKNHEVFLIYEIVEYYTIRIVYTAVPTVILGVVFTAYDEIMIKYAKIINIISMFILCHCGKYIAAIVVGILLR